MMSPRQGWQWDWAGKHGTGWGTVNACLTTATLSIVGHNVQLHWPAPTAPTVLTAAGATVLGVLWVLLRASVGRPRPAATVVYQVLCYAGAGTWIAANLSDRDWTWRGWLTSIGLLVGLAIVAGLLASLAEEITDKPAPVRPGTDLAQRKRDARADDLVARLLRLGAPDGIEILGIEDWPRGNGYTVEGTTAGAPWRVVADLAPKLLADLDLAHGCTVTGSKGVSARRWLLEVMTRNYLAEDVNYPTDYRIHSINDPLDRAMVTKDGNRIGPLVRSHSMALFGEVESGKSNAGGVLAAEIVTTDDALLWMWELTGGNLWNGWMTPWLRGETRVPPIDWCAFDGRELLWMTRAALRIGYARKTVYQDLQNEVDDDKLPVSAEIPAVIVMGDEVASVTGSMSAHPTACENLRLIAFELRSAAVRAIFLALRGTSDVFIESIQSQCAIRAVMRVGSPAEAAWALGRHTGFGPDDTPYPGCGGISLQSGADLVAVKWARIKPSQKRQIAAAVQDRRPVLDGPSALAANGRNADGTPMSELLPGELDCYDKRWERLRAFYGGAATRPAAASVPTTADGSSEQAVADLERAMAELDAAATAARQEQEPDADVRAEFERVLREAGWDPAEIAAPEPDDEPAPPSGWKERAEQIVRNAGDAGMKPGELHAILKAEGLAVHRGTVQELLAEWKAAGLVVKPAYGRWRWAPGK
jgi:hypothetical protein